MEPPAASPDPAPQEHSSPAPSPAKRSAWKHPAPNGVADAPAPAPAVMDANHWPALSETAKVTTKPAPASDSSRPPDSSPAPVASSPVANPSNSQRHSSGPHHGRHKPARRGGGNGGDHSPRDHPDRGAGGWDHGAGGGGGRGGHRNHGSGGGGGRRGNGGGGSGHHHGGGGGGGGGGFGGRRRGGYDGFYRGPHPMGMGPYMRGAPPPPPPMAVAAPFMGPPPPPVSPMRGFAGPMLFHDMPSPVSPVSPMYYFTPHPPPEALRAMALAPPMVGPPAYPYFQALHEPQPEPEPEPETEPELEPEKKRAELLQQIEFYFSKDNLCGDVYLRQQMDDQGWVDISVIAGFKKVLKLTQDLQYIKDIVQSSSILEMQDNKIRTQNNWEIWVLPRGSNHDIPSSSASVPSPNGNNLSAHLGGIGLHESAGSSSMVDHQSHEVLQNGSPSGNEQVPVAEDNSGHH